MKPVHPAGNNKQRMRRLMIRHIAAALLVGVTANSHSAQQPAADLGVRDRNPYTIPTGEIRNMRCKMTVLDGDIVFSTADVIAP